MGREQEIATVRQLLAANRLVTLTGTGGVGKTRLALQAATELVSSYQDGVWLVELAPLADPALVPQAAATAVGVREQPGRPLPQTLADALRPRRLLLVLDNCEHLVTACAELAEVLLRACPNLCILATSREVLRIAGETAWRVPPLGLPPLSAGPGPPTGLLVSPRLEQVEDSEAVRLFAARAAAALPGFALTDGNGPTVARICHHLDGLPLAIELAAARVSVLGLEQLTARLADRFRLLTGGSRTALPRHQTLRATLEWSYALLPEPEQQLFERLAVFAGGWTLEAAEAVGAGQGIDPADVLELLAQLVNKSLVAAQEGLGGEARYRLLETLRQYGWEGLTRRGDLEATQRRHAAFFLALAERAEPEMTGAEQGLWLARLEQEHDNLRAALQWAMDCAEAELGLRLAGALERFWWVRGRTSEGRRWLEGLLAVAGSGGAALAATRAKALSGAGILAGEQSDYPRAAALLEENLALCRSLGDKRGSAWSLSYLAAMARDQAEYRRATELLEESLALFRDLGDNVGSAYALNHLGRTATYQGDHARAAALLEESLALSRDLGDKVGSAYALINLGRAATYQGEHARAAALLEESLALSRGLGDQWGRAWSLHTLARAATYQAEYSRATALLEESLGLFRDLEDKRGIAWSLNDLARVARQQGEYSRAMALLEESLALRWNLGDKRGIAECLEELAGLATHTEQPEQAVRLFGAAQALREAIGAPLPPADHALYERSVAAARMCLGEEALAAAWAAGRTMAPEQVLDIALESYQQSQNPASNNGVNLHSTPVSYVFHST